MSARARKEITPLLAVTTLLLFLSTPAFATYGWTPSYGLVDQTPWCATNNCLTLISGDMTEIKAAPDGTIYGIDPGNGVFTFAAGLWSLAPASLQTVGGLPIIHLSVGSATYVLALSSAVYPANNVFVLNAGAWLAQPLWSSNAEIGGDGTIVGTGFYGYMNARIGGTWSLLAADSPGPFGVGDANNIWTTAGGILQSWNGTAWVPLASQPTLFTPSQALNSIAAAGGWLSVIGTDGSIHVSPNNFYNRNTILGTVTGGITGAGAMLFVYNSYDRTPPTKTGITST